MRIAIIGAGAMGSIFGGYLSEKHEVLLVDVNQYHVDTINRQGLRIIERDGQVKICYPKATVNTASMIAADVVVLFVKSMFSRSALYSYRNLIGPHTYLMTLQNGCGHEEMLMEFVNRDHIIIGTTQHNGAMIGPGEVRHGGSGKTGIGVVTGDVRRIEPIARAFSEAGIETACESEVQSLIWNKLLTNVSASVLTGILQVPLGFIAENPSAWALCEALVREAVAVARGEGIAFDEEEKIAEVRAVCENSPQGLTSIYMDLKEGRLTEVDTISGSVVYASRRNGVPAPTHEKMVQLVHALEAKNNLHRR